MPIDKFRLKKTISEFLKEGATDETLVMKIVEEHCGGKTWKSTKREDMFKHIDFWWESPKKGLVGVDVKGIKRNARQDTKKDDSINWVELVGVTGYPGWVYGESEYIAFRTLSDIIFVKTSVLRDFAENMTKDKETVYQLPSECYVPYQRYGRKDKVIKVLTEDLRRLSENKGFILKYSDVN